MNQVIDIIVLDSRFHGNDARENCHSRETRPREGGERESISGDPVCSFSFVISGPGGKRGNHTGCDWIL